VAKVFWDSLLEWILLFHLTENLIEMRLGTKLNILGGTSHRREG
jgi:hypothetical protein